MPPRKKTKRAPELYKYDFYAELRANDMSRVCAVLAPLMPLWKESILYEKNTGGFLLLIFGRTPEDPILGIHCSVILSLNAPKPYDLNFTNPFTFKREDIEDASSNAVMVDSTGTFVLCHSPYTSVSGFLLTTTLLWVPVHQLVDMAERAKKKLRYVHGWFISGATVCRTCGATVFCSCSERWRSAPLGGSRQLCVGDVSICLVRNLPTSRTIEYVMHQLEEARLLKVDDVAVHTRLEFHERNGRETGNFLEVWYAPSFTMEPNLTPGPIDKGPFFKRTNECGCSEVILECAGQRSSVVKKLHRQKQEGLLNEFNRCQHNRDKAVRAKARADKAEAAEQRAVDRLIARVVKPVVAAAIANLPVWEEVRKQSVCRGYAPPALVESDSSRSARLAWQREEREEFLAERAEQRAERNAKEQREREAARAVASQAAAPQREQRRLAQLARRRARRDVIAEEERREQARRERNRESALEERVHRAARHAEVQLQRFRDSEALRLVREASRDVRRVFRMRRRAERRAAAAPPLAEPLAKPLAELPAELPAEPPPEPPSPSATAHSYPSTAVGSVWECPVCFSENPQTAALSDCGHVFCAVCCSRLLACAKCGVPVVNPAFMVYL